MAINFTVGEYVIINRAYVDKVLPSTSSGNSQTLSSLGYIGESPAEVLETGTVFTTGTTKSYMRVRPTVATNPSSNQGSGVIVYFTSDAHLNNSFELSTAFLDDKCYIKAQNVSGSAITKGQLVYQSGFDGTLQLPNINLAAATSATTCAVLGLAAADIDVAECGSILVEGSFVGLDTSGFANVGATVYLSDTPGGISATPGTNEKVVARVASIDAADGTIIMDSVTAGTGGGGSGGFFTDGTGTNAAIGKGATAPTATAENALAQGNNAVASGVNAFALGTNVTASADSTLSHGYANTVSNPNSAAQGQNNTVSSSYSFAQGRNNTVRSPQSMAQGRNLIMPVYGRSNSMFGYNNTLSGTSAYQSAVFGSYHDVSDAYDALIWGYDQNITSASGLISGGWQNYITTTAYYGFMRF